VRVLISGASVAGPVLAYWLSRHGYSVTVVERARTLLRLATKSARVYDAMTVDGYDFL
jgi:2-polyprenyl-6-methoxyphenol hydroxylase-like FAD-dependent oxidoreductase